LGRRGESESSEAARKYLDEAIRRHKDSGDKKAVPKDVYQRALTSIAKTVSEFQALGKGA
jgi:hypothetical protein